LIAQVSRHSVDAMSDIVWAINPQKYQLSDLTQRMRRFASDAFTARQIEFQFDASYAEPDTCLNSQLRRELFLIFKESVNNAARHAQCTRAEISFGIARGVVTLAVRDNGQGFNPARIGDGQGLCSMRQRAAKVGGELRVLSDAGAGTTVLLRVPLNRRD